ncbi:MAG TPA: zf-HC2 domain-containing protein [Ktedonobacterales bacterium]
MSGYHDNPEQLTEALSAYLDGALSTAERDALERHLAGCPACQKELAGLIRVGALLRALPEPPLPRSFTLPAPAAHGARAGVTRRAPVWARGAQWAGGLAAVLGAGLLAAGTLPLAGFHPGAGGASRSAPSLGASSSAPAGTYPARTPLFGQSPVATSTTPAATVSPTTESPTETPTVISPAPESGSGSPLTPVGAVLLIGGGAALAAGTVTRRRARRLGPL